MKIAHVVTYLSSDHAFGGPVSVALAQSSELARRGHDVDLYAGWDGAAHLDTAPVRLHTFKARQALPGAGFSGLVAPGLSRALLRGPAYDVVHVHLARDLITLPAAGRLLRRGVRYVVQPHGMVMPDPRLRARVLDNVATRAALRGAYSVLALTQEESLGVQRVAGAQLLVARIGNGVPAAPEFEDRLADGVPEVLFLARLHPRKRVQAFVEMAALLQARGVAARFTIGGPDEGELGAVRDRIRRHELQSTVTYDGAIPREQVLARLAGASVFVLPSVNEPFAMTILESLSVATPTVVTDTCQIADVLRHYDAALVTDGSPEALADAVSDVLGKPGVASRLRAGSRRAMQEEFSISAVADRLEEIYSE